MKIISQSADELVLQEGSASGMIAGGAFVVAGPPVWYFLHRSNPVVIRVALGLVAIGVAVILFSSSITVRILDLPLLWRNRSWFSKTGVAARVAEFLNVPFQEIAPPNMGGGINIIAR